MTRSTESCLKGRGEDDGMGMSGPAFGGEVLDVGIDGGDGSNGGSGGCGERGSFHVSD